MVCKGEHCRQLQANRALSLQVALNQHLAQKVLFRVKLIGNMVENLITSKTNVVNCKMFLHNGHQLLDIHLD